MKNGDPLRFAKAAQRHFAASPRRGPIRCRPLLILAAPRSFTSVVCAALGQHPQMYGLPELHLFVADTLAGRERFQARSKFNIDHGLLRVVAELFFGGQTENNVRRAAGWLLRRAGFSPGYIIRQIAAKVAPRILVEKSPSTGRAIEYLERAADMFPGARFLHLVRHPMGYGDSIVKYLKRRAERNPTGAGAARSPEACATRSKTSPGTPRVDPQISWFELHTNIRRFLETVEGSRQMRVRGEDLLADPDRFLRQIVDWMELRTDAAAIEAMKHPERSPYACFGPLGAQGGNDPFFLENPVLRPEKAMPLSLDGVPGWCRRPHGFLPKVKQLAKQFGYR
jgi:hypothetical protein